MRITHTYQNSLRQSRASSGVTQINLAVASGISIPTINRLENHPLPTRPETAERLAKALGCRVADIFPYLATKKEVVR